MRLFAMIGPAITFVTGALLLTLSACTCCREWLKPGVAQSIPRHPLTWDEFVETQRARGVPIADIQRRFKVADADHDNILTPAEIQQHRIIAARNKKQRE